MKRVAINALVAIGCLITFILPLITGIVLYVFLPSGTGRELGHRDGDHPDTPSPFCVPYRSHPPAPWEGGVRDTPPPVCRKRPPVPWFGEGYAAISPPEVWSGKTVQ
ncbi:hypothetical protein Metfor_0810 [Methanoregula formicica SMSP]|uniref:Uncharacterized protein n=1 Tax=Methanoregula formicica (strain DSM 22288 / NBRC 105244 / SMSP) TaxID=593750 RepID=L0HCX5_METFS|nr:hypothetical protein Metfor_0810 [Methanoregula formicica SMSP]